MSVTAAVSNGSTVIVWVAGSSDSDMPLTVMPVFFVDPAPTWFCVVCSTDVGVVGNEESPPPQPATVVTIKGTAMRQAKYVDLFSTGQDTEKVRSLKPSGLSEVLKIKIDST